MSAPRAEDIDYMCDDCGLIKAGPHKGEHVPEAQRGALHYKGAEISNGFCPECAAKRTQAARAEHYKRHWWFGKGI